MPEVLAEHTLRVGQDVSVWYKQKPSPGAASKRDVSLVYIGRVTCIRLRKGKSSTILNGPVSLQKRLLGVFFQCAWFQQLPDACRLDSGLSCSPVFGLGPPTLEPGTC